MSLKRSGTTGREKTKRLTFYGRVLSLARVVAANPKSVQEKAEAEKVVQLMSKQERAA